jgi:hypothetical protein
MDDANEGTSECVGAGRPHRGGQFRNLEAHGLMAAFTDGFPLWTTSFRDLDWALHGWAERVATGEL